MPRKDSAASDMDVHRTGSWRNDRRGMSRLCFPVQAALAFCLTVLLLGLPASDPGEPAAAPGSVLRPGPGDAGGEVIDRRIGGGQRSAAEGAPVPGTKAQRERHAVFKGGGTIWGHGVGRKVALTFDDGPHYQTTPRLLDHLDRFGVKATFFVNSQRAHPGGLVTAKNHEVLEEIIRRGHLVGNHTHSHPNLAELSRARQTKQIQLADRIIRRVTGVTSYLFRPPYGKLTPHAEELLRRRGSTVVMWNLGSEDDRHFNVSKVVNGLMRKLERTGGGIILMHDTHYWTVEAVPALLQAIRVEGCKQLSRGEDPYEVVGLDYFLRQRAGRDSSQRGRRGARGAAASPAPKEGRPDATTDSTPGVDPRRPAVSRTDETERRRWLRARAAMVRRCRIEPQVPAPAFIRGEDL